MNNLFAKKLSGTPLIIVDIGAAGGIYKRWENL